MVKHQQLIEESKTPCAFYHVFTPIFHMDKLACILSLFAHKLNTIWRVMSFGVEPKHEKQGLFTYSISLGCSN